MGGTATARITAVEGLVTALYEAALVPEQIPEVLRQLGAQIGFNGAVLGTAENVNSVWRPAVDWRTGVDNELTDWGHRNLMSPDVNPFFHHLHRYPVNRAFRMSPFEPWENWQKYPVYQQYMKPQGVIGCACAVMEKKRIVLTCISLYRDISKGELDDEELALFNYIVPHLGQAARIAQRLARTRAERDGLAAVAHRLAQGVVILDRSGRLIFANARAEEIFSERDGLSVREGRLRAARPLDTDRLNRLIAGAARTGSGQGTPPGGALSLSRPSGRRPLSVLVAPLTSFDFGLGARAPAAVVFVSDPERRHEAPSELLARLYGLTPREAAFAARLLQGQSVVEAAKALGVSLNTARTHVKQIFAKTGADRQSALVRLVLRGPAGLRSTKDQVW